MNFLGVPEGELHGLSRGKLYHPRHDCPECQVEILERVTEGGCRVKDHGSFLMVFGQMFGKHPCPPPADAKEWACRHCGGDSLWCDCQYKLRRER